MVPTPRSLQSLNHGVGARSSRLLYTLLSCATQVVPKLFHSGPANDSVHVLAKREKFDASQPKYIVFAVLIPVLVLLSGLFAGLTLGYMSLDETQLNVLCISGTAQQREYANKIKPIRKNGHLLLVTLLLANMIVNESLPVIADPVLGGGVESVVVSTVLIVIFSEIIPQSLFTRHGLYLGAKMAGFTKCLLYTFGIVAWPVAKLLEFVLGSQHGIIYRRAELKELIAMHSATNANGGDLKHDTVAIIGATLDLQEKVVEQAMTPIDQVFMLEINSRLDFALLKKICATGHSRVPVYELVDVPLSAQIGTTEPGNVHTENGQSMMKAKKILGILLVKQCVLLDPSDSIPLRQMPLNKVPQVPGNESLLNLLDRFQEGRSHMAIVSRFSVEKAKSVKKAVKRGLTQRFKQKVGMGDSSSDSETDSEDDHEARNSVHSNSNASDPEKEVKPSTRRGRSKKKQEKKDEEDIEMGTASGAKGPVKNMMSGFQMTTLEQAMPADAVLAKEGAAEFLAGLDPAVMPLGIITLEDVLEELIGEEIYDEFDTQGAHGDEYVHIQPTPAVVAPTPAKGIPLAGPAPGAKLLSNPIGLRSFSFLRSRSTPPTTRATDSTTTSAMDTRTEKTDPVHLSPMTEMPDPILKNATPSRKPSADAATDSNLGVGQSPTDASEDTSSHAHAHIVAPIPQKVAPLGAILLGRKRRLNSSSDPVASEGEIKSRAVASGAKGTMFKSSPLGVKTPPGNAETTTSNGEDKLIPDVKDKEDQDHSEDTQV